MIYCIFQKNNTVLAASCANNASSGTFIGLWGEDFLLNNILITHPNSPILHWNTSFVNAPAQLFGEDNPPIINKSTISHIFTQAENDALVAFFETSEFLSFYGYNDYPSFANACPAAAQVVDLIKMVATDTQAIWYIIESADKPVIAGDELYALLFFYIVANRFLVQEIYWNSTYSAKAILLDYIYGTTDNTAGIFNLTDVDIANIVNSNWLAGTTDINGYAFIPLPTALHPLLLDVWHNRVPALSSPAPQQLEAINPMIANYLAFGDYYPPEPFTTYYNCLRKMLKRM